MMVPKYDAIKDLGKNSESGEFGENNKNVLADIFSDGELQGNLRIYERSNKSGLTSASNRIPRGIKNILATTINMSASVAANKPRKCCLTVIEST